MTPGPHTLVARTDANAQADRDGLLPRNQLRNHADPTGQQCALGEDSGVVELDCAGFNQRKFNSHNRSSLRATP